MFEEYEPEEYNLVLKFIKEFPNKEEGKLVDYKKLQDAVWEVCEISSRRFEKIINALITNGEIYEPVFGKLCYTGS